MKMEQTEYSETSAYKIQTPGNYPKESIQHIRFSLATSSKRAFQTKVYGPYGGCKLPHEPVWSRNLDDVSARQFQNNGHREEICVTTYKVCISKLQKEQRHFD